MGYVYFIKVSGKNIFKIGMTEGSPYERLEQIQTYHYEELKVYDFMETLTPKILEKQVHRKFKEYRIKREWFNISEEVVRKFLDNPEGLPIDKYLVIRENKKASHIYRASDEKLFRVVPANPVTYEDKRVNAMLYGRFTRINGKKVIDMDIMIQEYYRKDDNSKLANIIEEIARITLDMARKLVEESQDWEYGIREANTLYFFEGNVPTGVHLEMKKG